MHRQTQSLQSVKHLLLSRACPSSSYAGQRPVEPHTLLASWQPYLAHELTTIVVHAADDRSHLASCSLRCISLV